MASRLLLANTATRPKMHARCMLSGPPGAGKTDTALTIARELAKGDLSKILVIDTEKDSALTYADRFPGFRHLPWDPPYAPSELGTTVIEASKQPETEVIIIDSLTHFWRKRGGTMDIAGGKFGGWKAARPIQEEMVDALLGAQCHVIVCVRSKVEYAQMEDEQRRGRQKVVKMGMEPQQDGDLEYEMNIAIEMDMEHAMYVGKSRTTDIPVGRVYAPGQAAEFGAHYTDWLAGGTEISALSLEALQTTLGQLHPDVVQRMRVLWTERGLPNINELNPAQVNRVVGLIEQAQADFNAQQPAGAPFAAAPAQQPTPQPNGPQNGAQPPQGAQQSPTQQGYQQPQQEGYAQDAGSAALQQQRQHAQQGGIQPAVMEYQYQ